MAMTSASGRFRIGLCRAALIALALFGAGARAQSEPSRISTEERALGLPRGSTIPSSDGAKAGDGGWIRTAVALGGVLILIAGVHWGFKHLSRRSGGLVLAAASRAPSGVLEVLGRYPVSRGQSLLLLKMDRRVLLLGQSGAGFTTLAEVTDEDEVASLVLKTRDDEGASNAARFNDMLRRLESDPSVIAEERGGIDRGDSPLARLFPSRGVKA